MNGNKAPGNDFRIHENATVTNLLLEHGANPRLYGVQSNPHAVGHPSRAIDEAKAAISSLLLEMMVLERPRSNYYAPREMDFLEEAYKHQFADRFDA